MSEERETGELMRRDAWAELRKTMRQLGKTTTMLFLSTPTAVLPIKPDPVAEDRAKRYGIHIERTQAGDWRAD